MDTSIIRAPQDEVASRSLRDELARLTARVGALEASAGASRPVEEAVSDEVLAVISAAVAAFLGHKRIRQIRIAGSQSWARQGRVVIQGSHSLAQHAR
jgi:methylmalonyl-CoA carboxyltransferase 12S subunit